MTIKLNSVNQHSMSGQPCDVGRRLRTPANRIIAGDLGSGPAGHHDHHNFDPSRPLPGRMDQT